MINRNRIMNVKIYGTTTSYGVCAWYPVTTGTSYGVLRSWYLRLQKRSLTLLSHPLLAHFLACMINKNAAVTSALKIWVLVPYSSSFPRL